MNQGVKYVKRGVSPDLRRRKTMEEQNKDIEMMRQLIEKKKQKSASQGSIKHGPEDRNGTSRPGNKKKKKGGLPPK